MSVRIFGHYVSLPLLLLMLAEAAINVGAVYLAGTVRFLDIHFQVQSHTGESLWLFPRALLYALVMLATMTAFGLYGSELHQKDREYQVRFLASFPAVAVVLAFVYYAVPESTLARGIMALGLLFSFLFTASARAAGFNLVGFVQCGDGEPYPDKSKLLGDCKALRALVEQHRVDEIVVGVRDRRNGHLSMSELLECKLEGISIVDLPTFFERESGHVQLKSLNPSWMIYSMGFGRSGFQQILKRVFDVWVSGAMLIATLPVMLFATLAIWLETGRPILYRQKRVGECGEVFEILKFRSMRADAEKDGVARWAKENDDRVTRVGKLLRLTRIDELPQLFNVLRGDMSFVGPRPERPPFVNELSRKVPFYASRHSVKPGITGWAQIRYPYGASVDDAVYKLQFDLYYVKNHSLFLDLVILFQTAQVVLFGQGAR